MSRLQTGIPFAGNEFTIVPIEEVWADSYPVGRGLWAGGTKKPVALVFCKPSEVRAVGIEGNEVDLEDLTGEVAGLNEVLEQLSGTRGAG